MRAPAPIAPQATACQPSSWSRLAVVCMDPEGWGFEGLRVGGLEGWRVGGWEGIACLQDWVAIAGLTGSCRDEDLGFQRGHSGTSRCFRASRARDVSFKASEVGHGLETPPNPRTRSSRSWGLCVCLSRWQVQYQNRLASARIREYLKEQLPQQDIAGV